MDAAALISGGKDSALALHRVLEEGHNVKFLVAMIPQREDSWMFHYPNIHLTDLFAKSADIPLVKEKTSGLKERELEDLKRVLAKLDVESVVSGAIASQYQKQRVQRICEELRLSLITPLWKEDPVKLLKELVDFKFEAIITGVYAHGFDVSWLGRQIDQGTIKALISLQQKYGISVVGEGGEYETLVLEAPFFNKRMQLAETEKIWEKQSGHLLIKKAHLTDR
ncbi:MAG: diphthine--ammonia ligase [Candidatus Bathyarchaeia archaeon]